LPLHIGPMKTRRARGTVLAAAAAGGEAMVGGGAKGRGGYDPNYALCKEVSA
jgi:hypothetical protein